MKLNCSLSCFFRIDDEALAGTSLDFPQPNDFFPSWWLMRTTQASEESHPLAVSDKFYVSFRFFAVPYLGTMAPQGMYPIKDVTHNKCG